MDKIYKNSNITFNKVPKGKVFIVGQGMNTVDTLLVKALKVIQQCDTLYCQPHTSKDILEQTKPNCRVINTFNSNFFETMQAVANAYNCGKIVVMLHSGDTSIFGTIQEQLDYLVKNNIECEVIAGVSAYSVAMAKLKCEFILYGLNHAVIITKGDDSLYPSVKGQDLKSFAKHNACMAIYMIHNILYVKESLLAGGMDSNTPVVLCYDICCENERYIHCTLKDVDQYFINTYNCLMLVGKCLGDLELSYE